MAMAAEPVPTRFQRLIQYIEKEATFFRVHLIAFTFIPLIVSGIFYACNGRFPVSYLDSLFLCYSAMTVTGLSTVNLSTVTAWQQVLLYLLMLIGDITVVSWIMVLVRKEYFQRRCESEYIKRHKEATRALFSTISRPIAVFKARQPVPACRHEFTSNVIEPTPAATLDHYPSSSENQQATGELLLGDLDRVTSSPKAGSIALTSTEIEQPLEFLSASPRRSGVDFAYTTSLTPSVAQRRRLETIREGVPLPHRTTTILTHRTIPHTNTYAANEQKYKDLGGFPGPIELSQRLFRRMAPRLYLRMERSLTIPIATTLERTNTKWLNFDLTVGRNSDFKIDDLTDEQLEEIGGVEYIALRYLSYLVPLLQPKPVTVNRRFKPFQILATRFERKLKRGLQTVYFVGTQLITYLLFGPWISVTTHYDPVFEAQPRIVKKPWFALFQVMGAYTGGGLSLVDQGMVPFQKAYLMTISLIFVILAGNHAMPIFLRFIIWIGSRVAREGTDAEKAFSFLLDHPRRCFIYLFPSHQTWFLLIVLVIFSVVEWILFEVLNIGLEAYESLSIGPRIICGLFQGLAARASGFSIVPLASFAPALQFLYVVMMYIAIYPIAISIRATNSYEEQSLGVFEQPAEETEPQNQELKGLDVRQRVHRYVGWHLKKQVSMDIWWLIWGVFLVTIIERNNLLDPDKKWFDIFRIIFEMVSAFGGIGLSLGLPSDNFSFVGAMRPLSKLVVIVTMVRGRHRGLPVAVDRAIMLPYELVKQRQQQGGEGNRPQSP
ncbi:TrkH-domain-containing protein [Marasmius fiardii PR-910]|nr:TrkH-domain-containing protein [Marasmius fiardii PR-910]